jgi:hypothetical protein
VTCFKVGNLSQQSPGETEDKHDTTVKIASSLAEFRTGLCPEYRSRERPLRQRLGNIIIKWVLRRSVVGIGTY